MKLLEDHLKLLRKSREFTGAHRVETRFDAEEIWCDLDANRMKQVFWNLSTNALKAMPHGGGLSISVKTDAARNEVGSRIRR